MKLQYKIVNKDNLQQSSILAALYQTTMDSVYEYGVNVVEGRGLIYTTKQNPNEIINLININLAKYDIPELDEGICQLIRDYGTLVYYDAENGVTRSIMWAPGSYRIPALDNLALDILALPSLSVPANPTWDICINKVVPSKYIRMGKLYQFVNHKKSLFLLKKKLQMWIDRSEMSLEPADVVTLWNLNVAHAIRKITKSRLDPK